MNRELTIGRGEDNDILIPDPSVSRRHASLFISGSECSIRDNQSSNGTYINGMRINGTVALKKNDILKLGNSLVPWMGYIDLSSIKKETDIEIDSSQGHHAAANQQQKALPNSGGALTCGIIGVVLSFGLVGIILNIIALSLGGGAVSRYRQNPGLYTEGSYKNAKAGQVLGIIGLCLFVLVLLIIIAANA